MPAMVPGHWEPASDLARVARLYDALLGGVNANAEDKALARGIEDRSPAMPCLLKAARCFQSRAAERAVRGGARGVVFGAAGYPLRPCRHEAAMAARPGAAFCYADCDPWITAVLEERNGVSACCASVRDPGDLLSRPEVKGIGEPLQVQLPLCLHYWPPVFAARLIGAYGRLLAPGSSLAVSFAVAATGREAGREFTRLLAEMGGTPAYMHRPGTVSRWLDGAGLHPVYPGTADVRWWPLMDLRPLPAVPVRRAGGRFLGVVAVRRLVPGRRPAAAGRVPGVPPPAPPRRRTSRPAMPRQALRRWPGTRRARGGSPAAPSPPRPSPGPCLPPRLPSVW